MAYSIAEAADLLKISPLTLRAWLNEAKISPEQSPTDKRSWIISREQIEQLAREHKRGVIFPRVPLGERRDDASLVELKQQVAVLEGKLERQDSISQTIQELVLRLSAENKQLNQRTQALSETVLSLQSRLNDD